MARARGRAKTAAQPAPHDRGPLTEEGKARVKYIISTLHEEKAKLDESQIDYMLAVGPLMYGNGNLGYALPMVHCNLRSLLANILAGGNPPPTHLILGLRMALDGLQMAAGGQIEYAQECVLDRYRGLSDVCSPEVARLLRTAEGMLRDLKKDGDETRGKKKT